MDFNKPQHPIRTLANLSNYFFSDFVQSLSREYGNCYTFNSREQENKTVSYKSINSGYNLGTIKLHLKSTVYDSKYLKPIDYHQCNYSIVFAYIGLQLTLFIRDDEYLQGVTIAKGVKVTPHHFGTMPNLDTGISLAPGFETYIGLRQVGIVIDHFSRFIIITRS